MVDDTDADADATADADEEQDTGADVGHDLEAERTTAPMSDYGSREVAIGVVVTIVGVAIAFGVPVATIGL